MLTFSGVGLLWVAPDRDKVTDQALHRTMAARTPERSTIVSTPLTRRPGSAWNPSRFGLGDYAERDPSPLVHRSTAAIEFRWPACRDSPLSLSALRATTEKVPARLEHAARRPPQDHEGLGAGHSVESDFDTAIGGGRVARRRLVLRVGLRRAEGARRVID